STEENPTHMYSSSGQYVITLTVYGECDTITTTNAVSVYNVGNEEFITGSVEMYPNPATENVNLVFKGVNVGDAKIKLIDLSGKVILIKQVPVGDGSVVTLDLNSISMGVYTVSIDINGEVKVLKLVRK
ncbi:MAG TPA: T9SS type A sorting domain-containing protein, partial [Bacteroidia bacterium]